MGKKRMKRVKQMAAVLAVSLAASSIQVSAAEVTAQEPESASVSSDSSILEINRETVQEPEPALASSGIIKYEEEGNSYISLNLGSGELIIYNKKAMKDYDQENLPGWYAYRANIKKVTINGSLDKIGDYAFYGCSSLKEVSLNNDLREVGEGAFYECRGIEKLSFGSGIRIIDSFAFYNCGGLKNVEFESSASLEKVESHAFALCGKLSGICLPDTVKTIEDNAFVKCTSIQNIFSQNAAAETIGFGAFAYCSSLEQVSLSVVRTVEASAFYECTGLKKVSMPKAETLEEYAFYSCSGIQNFSAPNAEFVGDYALAECSQIQSLAFGKKLKEIGTGVLEDCARLNRIEFAKDGILEKIGESAFHNCTSLVDIMIPESVAVIDSYAFAGCSKLEIIEVYSRKARLGKEVCKNLAVTMFFYGGAAGIADARIQNIHFEYFTMISTRELSVSYTPNWVYTGVQIKPKVTVKYQNKLLKENQDYAVAYGTNIFGTGTITIQGRHSYCDSIVKTFTIGKASQSLTRKPSYQKTVLNRSFSVVPGNIKEKAACTYSVKNSKIAVCDKYGRVTLKGKEGNTQIVITVKETAHYKGTTLVIPLKVKKGTQNISVKQKAYDKYVTDEAWRLNARVKGNAKVSYSVSNKKIAVCDKYGRVTLKGKTGKVTITIKAKETGKYYGAAKKITINVKKLPTVKLKAYKTSKGFKLQWNKVKNAAQVKYCFKIKKWTKKWYDTYSTRNYQYRGGRIRSNLWVKIRVYDKKGRLIAESKSVKAR